MEFILYILPSMQMLMRMESMASLYRVVSVFGSRKNKSWRGICYRSSVMVAPWVGRKVCTRYDMMILSAIWQCSHKTSITWRDAMLLGKWEMGMDAMQSVSLLCSFFIFSGSAAVHCFCRCKYTYAYLRTRSRKINRQALVSRFVQPSSFPSSWSEKL